MAEVQEVEVSLSTPQAQSYHAESWLTTHTHPCSIILRSRDQDLDATARGTGGFGSTGGFGAASAQKQ